MASGFLQSDSLLTPILERAETHSVHSVLLITSFHGTAGVSNNKVMTRKNGSRHKVLVLLERERVRLQISPTLMQDREIVQRSGDGSLLL